MNIDDFVTVARALVLAFGEDAPRPTAHSRGMCVGIYTIRCSGGNYLLIRGTDDVAQDGDLNVVVAALIADMKKEAAL